MVDHLVANLPTNREPTNCASILHAASPIAFVDAEAKDKVPVSTLTNETSVAAVAVVAPRTKNLAAAGRRQRFASLKRKTKSLLSGKFFGKVLSRRQWVEV